MLHLAQCMNMHDHLHCSRWHYWPHVQAIHLVHCLFFTIRGAPFARRAEACAAQHAIHSSFRKHSDHPLHTLQTQKHVAAKQSSIRTDTAMPVTSHTNGTSPFSNHLERSSTPSYRLRHEYRGGHKPNDELDRISTLQSLNILDTKPEAKYDDITKLLCSIFDMPIGQLSLVDSNRQWCKSLQGHDVREIDRNTAFCAWVLLPKHPQALVVEDTLMDARYVLFSCTPLPSCSFSPCTQFAV